MKTFNQFNEDIAQRRVLAAQTRDELLALQKDKQASYKQQQEKRRRLQLQANAEKKAEQQERREREEELKALKQQLKQELQPEQP